MQRAEVLKRLIEETGLNTKAFSEKAGIPYTTLRSILMRGVGGASVDNVLKVCRALGITAEEMERLAFGSSEVEGASPIPELSEFEAFLSNPEHGLFFKDYLDAPEERKREMLTFWHFIKDLEKKKAESSDNIN
ncbi:helix-turn-helix transcriptional regulator [Paenibacillus sp. FSL R7-0204]|uniref:helix-turn-helix domain-containing protein n=1 Tax=Paenibacillus sp. FSL R7-0204 TaxID=2921675 RepID=UPI0030FB7206